MMDNKFVKALEVEIRREEEDFVDLMNDFEFVKDLNRTISLKYQDFIDSIPKPKEIDLITEKLKEDLKKAKEIDKKNIEQRLFQLMRFRSAAVILEKDDPDLKPVKYEELFGNGSK